MSPSTGKSKITRVVLVVALLVVLALLYALFGIDRADEPVQSTAVETPPVADAAVSPDPSPTPDVPETVEAPPPSVVSTPVEPPVPAEPAPVVEPPPLLVAPLLAEPADGNRMTVRMLPAEVDFVWETGSRVDGYQIEIARDPDFRNIVGEQSTSHPRFRHGNLSAGMVHWRVSSTLNGTAGLPGTVSSFEIVHDDDAPRLDVTYPESPIDNDTFLLAGSTEPGALVFHNDEQITTTEAGEFELWVTLKRGANVVTIEAIDPAGNVAYQTRMVSANY